MHCDNSKLLQQPLGETWLVWQAITRTASTVA